MKSPAIPRDTALDSEAVRTARIGRAASFCAAARRACPAGLLAGLALPLLLSVALPGCKLIDQETFAPTPEAKPTPPPPPIPVQVDPRTPLLTVDYSTPEPAWQEPLRYAVRAAEARDRRVQYDVTAVVPRLDDASEGQQRALTIMRGIIEQRVPASRVHLGLRADPTLTSPQVRVYVR
jgi:hypothetical protein